MNRGLWALVVAGACVGVACFVDPVHDDQVSALGSEAPGVPRGPLHRAGQPCLVCHGGTGPASHQFSIAGTAFAIKDQDLPLPSAVVTLTDSQDASVSLASNPVGNFYVTPDEYLPHWPVHTELSVPMSDGGLNVVTMNTHIGRDGSCATCHYEPPGPGSPGFVYLYTDPSDVPDAGIP